MDLSLEKMFSVSFEDTPISLSERLNDVILENKVLKRKLDSLLKLTNHYQETISKNDKRITMYLDMIMNCTHCYNKLNNSN